MTGTAGRNDESDLALPGSNPLTAPKSDNWQIVAPHLRKRWTRKPKNELIREDLCPMSGESSIETAISAAKW
jgi:hypothetical protein